jgi:glycosyltransferase involved in cell wall biosynthesis
VLESNPSASSPLVRGLVSIVIPAYNEAGTIETLLGRVERVPIAKEILMVDDGSTDGTRDLIQRFSDAGRVVAIFGGRNQGKGMAFRLGVERARGEVVIIQDADLEYDPAEIPQVVEPVLAGRADFCYGSRTRGKSTGRSSQAFYWGGRLVSWFTTALYATWITDEPTCYKAFRTDLLRTLPLEGRGFELEPELTAKALRRGFRYAEVPISYDPRKPTEGKKISWRDGLLAIWTLVVWRFRSF